ncbi:hypothetical protein CBOM_08125 [Ceraceosorus bombacis]|uniref:Uncharacterized protein n=1 Tax=Ceraceosorus bombacis TaxID=401625 RepID=A0A0P1B8Z9_9BASI|nr:hypothetical protein CBOM_08125 [Ceraceosorus bombacis]
MCRTRAESHASNRQEPRAHDRHCKLSRSAGAPLREAAVKTRDRNSQFRATKFLKLQEAAATAVLSARVDMRQVISESHLHRNQALRLIAQRREMAALQSAGIPTNRSAGQRTAIETIQEREQQDREENVLEQ